MTEDHHPEILNLCRVIEVLWSEIPLEKEQLVFSNLRDQGVYDSWDWAMNDPAGPGGLSQMTERAACAHENTAWCVGGPGDGEGFVKCRDCGMALHPDDDDRAGLSTNREGRDA